MTFKAFESSRRSGKPTHLFLFGRQANAWRFTNADRALTLGGKTYTSAPISRSAIKQTIEKAQDNVTITLPYSMDPNAIELPVTQSLGDNWHPYIPSDPISVMCMATHLNDPDQELAVQWIGYVQQPKFTDGQLELTCVPPGQISKAMYQGAKWQTSCWKTVYSTGIRGCNLVSANFEATATLTDVNGLTVTAAEFNGLALSLAGGEMWWARSDGLIERRSIMAHNGSTITLLYGAADIAIGLAVTVRPACERTFAACTARNNTDNYGGAIYKPVANPYNGQSMSWT